MRSILLLLILIAIQPIYSEPGAQIVLDKVMSRITPQRDMMTRVRIIPCVNSPFIEIGGYYMRSANTGSSLLMIIEPQDARGVSWLRKGSDFWAYSPGVRMFFRAGKKELLRSPVLAIMGITAGRLDIDYTAESTSEVIDNTFSCCKLVLKSKDETDQNPFLIIWALRDSYIPLRAEYCDKKLHALCSLYFLKWELKNQVYYPINTLSIYGQNERCKIKFEETTLTQLPEFIFTRAFCELMGN